MTGAEPALLLFVLVTVSTGGLLMSVVLPFVEGIGRRRNRFAEAAGGPVEVRGQKSDPAPSGARRRKAIEQTLREIEERRNSKGERRRKPSLQRRLREAGLAWSPLTYWLLSLSIAAIATGALLVLAPLPVVTAPGFGLATGLALPHLVVSFLRRRRLERFSAQFPDAIDVLVRGVRAGRPVADCLAIVASDSEEPLRGQFRLAVEDNSIGLPLEEVVERLADRIPLAEVNFLAIVIAIQSRAGGSLTEALSNLSSVLRARRQLRAKVKAMSAEAKASAGIIGVIPLVVVALMQVTSPDYIALLYQTLIGRVVVAICLMWMGIGVLVMRKMINFDM